MMKFASLPRDWDSIFHSPLRARTKLSAPDSTATFGPILAGAERLVAPLATINFMQGVRLSQRENLPAT
jgi:hypothetical protein